MLWGKKKHQTLPPDEDPTSLCNLLVTLGWISQETLERALRKKRDELIGQTLIEMRAITSEQLNEALAQQKIHRNEVSSKEATKDALERQSSMQTSMIENLKDFGATVAKAANTGKLTPIKRGAK